MRTLAGGTVGRDLTLDPGGIDAPAYTCSGFTRGRSGVRPLNLCRKVSIMVLSGDSNFPVRMQQEPFVGLAPPGPTGKLTVLHNASS